MEYQRRTSILLPSAYRAAQLAHAIDLILDTVGLLPIEICVSVVHDDFQSQNAMRGRDVVYDVRSRSEYERGAVYAWNKLLMRASGSILVLWADDLLPRAGWLDHALSYLASIGDGVVGLNDTYSNGNEYAAHWLTTRRFLLEHLGGVMYPPMYQSWWCDREVTDRAQALGRYVWAQEAIVEHKHYSFGVSDIDDTYRAAMPHYADDENTYKVRKLAGFPTDYKGVIR